MVTVLAGVKFAAIVHTCFWRSLPTHTNKFFPLDGPVVSLAGGYPSATLMIRYVGDGDAASFRGTSNLKMLVAVSR